MRLLIEKEHTYVHTQKATTQIGRVQIIEYLV